MYANNEAHRDRKLNYNRYRKLTKLGYSISDEAQGTSLYVINTDAFGRSYYEKPIGGSVKKDAWGKTYTQEEYAVKEFVIDNKTQLVNKASADLVVGSSIVLAPEFPDKVTEDDKTWLNDLVKENDLTVLLYERAMVNSSEGDVFFEVCLDEDKKIKIKPVDAYYVDIYQDNREVVCYEIAYEFELEGKNKTGFLNSGEKHRVCYVQKKLHYEGKIVYMLFEISDKAEPVLVPLSINPKNKELFEKCANSPNMRMLVSTEPEMETENQLDAYVIEEYTGVDEFLLVHWPNYRMFDVFGVSDNSMIESLQNALNNRITQYHDVLDKHGDPAMAGPEAYLDVNGTLEMSGGGGRYFPVPPGSNAPEYLTWDGHLAETVEEVKRLYKAILDNSEISAALVGDDSGGVESGRALLYKLIRSISMATRKNAYLEQAIKEIIEVAQKLNFVWVLGEGVTVTNPEIVDFDKVPSVFSITVKVKSSIPTDRSATIVDVSLATEKGLLSFETGARIVVALFDGVDVEDELKRIEKEKSKKSEDEKVAREAEYKALLDAEPSQNVTLDELDEEDDSPLIDKDEMSVKKNKRGVVDLNKE
jgi:hypothetical protein